MKTTFVLPLSTGKDIYLALNILIPSIYDFFILKDIKEILIILKKSDLELFNFRLDELKQKLDTKRLYIKIILENDLISEKITNTYYLQMYLKLKIAEKVKTKYYITLDADIYFCKKSSSLNFFKDKAYYKKINIKDKWGRRCEKQLDYNLEYQTNQTPFVFITSFVKNMLEEIDVKNYILKEKCSEYTLFLTYMLKNNYFESNYEIKEFCYKAITHHNYKNQYKSPDDIIIESFILKQNLVVNCIQSRTNIHNKILKILKKNMMSLTFKKLKIGVLTVVTTNYFKIYEQALFIKKNYCKYHNYDFIFDIIDKDKYPLGKGWLKLYKLKEQLKNYDYIFLSDADVVITNRDIRIEDILLKYGSDSKFLYLTTDYNSINTGNSIWKNCYQAFDFIDQVLNIGNNPIRNSNDDYYQPIGIYEQPSIIYIINTNEMFRNFIKIIPQYIMNSYIDLTPTLRQKNIIEYINNDFNRTNWKVGDFLIHFAGLNQENNGLYNLNNLVKKYSLVYKKLIIQKEDIDYGTIM